MCGIGGIALKPGKKVTQEMLSLLGDALAHRGPDGEGFYMHQNLGLVHRRLSIIDLEGGDQPLSDDEHKLQVVVNGEIYNYKELQKRVLEKGFRLKTQSDCEPILGLYKKHGPRFVDHLRGMFAIALVDEVEETITLARDPFGIKPLYYAEMSDGIMFASEPAALTKAEWAKAEVNEAVLPALLHRQYVSGQELLFKGVKRVMPGEVLVLKDGEIVEQYQHNPALVAAKNISEIEALERFDALMDESIQLHLQSDVPYGAFLSGGIDSSSMVTKMQQCVGEVQTYTIGFESDTVHDERSDAEALAKRLGCQQTSVSFGEKDFWQSLPAFAGLMDDLVVDYAALPLMKLAQHASQDVKMVLSGEGGDEILAGYGRYRLGFIQRLKGKKFRGKGSVTGFEHLFNDAMPLPSMVDVPASLSKLQQRQYIEMHDWLPDDLLTKVDRCLMAYGVEGRVPYLDSELAAYAFALPDDLKVRGKHGKWVLKHWLSQQQPEMDVWQKKRGFTVPMVAWLQGKQEEVGRYLKHHNAIQPMFKKDKLECFLTQKWSPKAAKLAFHLMGYALWHDAHITGTPVTHELFHQQD